MKEFLQALDEYQVMLMRGKYSLRELAAMRQRLIDCFPKQESK